MKPTTKQQPQSQKTQQSPEEKQLTLEELAAVAGGYIKLEDKDGNKIVLK